MGRQEDGLAAEGEGLPQGHADAYTLRFGFRRAIEDGFSLVGRLADHERPAAESGVALALHSDGEVGDEHAGDTHGRSTRSMTRITSDKE